MRHHFAHKRVADCKGPPDGRGVLPKLNIVGLQVDPELPFFQGHAKLTAASRTDHQRLDSWILESIHRVMPLKSNVRPLSKSVICDQTTVYG